MTLTFAQSRLLVALITALKAGSSAGGDEIRGSKEAPLERSHPQALIEPKSAGTDTTCDPAIEQVKQYCLQRQEVDVRTTALHFVEYDANYLSRYIRFGIPFITISG